MIKEALVSINKQDNKKMVSLLQGWIGQYLVLGSCLGGILIEARQDWGWLEAYCLSPVPFLVLQMRLCLRAVG